MTMTASNLEKTLLTTKNVMLLVKVANGLTVNKKVLSII